MLLTQTKKTKGTHHENNANHKKTTVSIKELPKKALSFPAEFKGYSKKKKSIVIACAIVVLAAITVGVSAGKANNEWAVTGAENKVARRDITSAITGSSVVKPKDQYSITALVSGDIMAANFEQGDIVAEGDILYQIDSSDAQNSIENADLSYQRSQMEYNKAQKTYNDLTVKAPFSGTVRNIYVKAGDSVSTGTKIADIYDDSVLTLTIPFSDADAQNILPGDPATVKISSNGEVLSGTVIGVASSGYAMAGNMIVRTVKIEVPNPGALTNAETATAEIGHVSGCSAGSFEYVASKTMTAEASGEIDAVYVLEGAKVSSGTAIVHIDSDTASDNLTASSLSLRSSALSRENAMDKLNDYTITAPISGTVVTKNIKAGDKLDNSNMSTVMAVIYDMSSLECELSVDELDIKNVEVGQSVIITSDAVEGQVYHGEVQSVSINGTTANGVTSYPVTIVITDFDEDLLPGMNIDVEITTSQAKDVLAIPIAAVNRGNIVYVKGEKTEDGDTAPEGYKSVKVETGVYNSEYIEIKAGLKEGDIVYTPQIQSSHEGSAMEAMMGGMGSMPGGGMPGGNRMPSGGMPGGMR
ncbi:MAG: HlyD family efflux transporter periplasmic adaptor subunit [Ruminococcaceae bacterium]|nr:HlyD family efflux transporter periplasmic adaptor subunit [Oscillospiraceae bacterium]